MHRILAVDDEAQIRLFLTQALADERYDVSVASDADEAMEQVRSKDFDLVLLDVRLPGTDGLDLLRRIKTHNPWTVVIVMTGYGTTETAVEAVRRGAYDYFSKPFRLEELRTVIHRALQRVGLLRQSEGERRSTRPGDVLPELVGQSESFLRTLEQIERMTHVDTPVALSGESGTGKTLVARAIHAHSGRSAGPYREVDAAARAAAALDKDLFGEEGSAATPGLLQVCKGGVLAVDHVGEMASAVQAKLVPVLDRRGTIGSGEDAPGWERRRSSVEEEASPTHEVRTVALSREPVETLRRWGRLREELAHRLAMFEIKLPPLRERPGDIPLLARYFLRRHAADQGSTVNDLTDEAILMLSGYDWPGNVRELQNCVERATVMAKGDVIDVGDLPDSIAQRGTAVDTSASGSLEDTLAQVERQILVDTLRKVNGVQARAAELLGISERSMWHRVKKHDISVETVKRYSRDS